MFPPTASCARSLSSTKDKPLSSQMAGAFVLRPLPSAPVGRSHTPPFVATRHLPPAGGSRPSRGRLLAVPQSFLPRERRPLGGAAERSEAEGVNISFCAKICRIRAWRLLFVGSSAILDSFARFGPATYFAQGFDTFLTRRNRVLRLLAAHPIQTTLWNKC